MIISKDIVILGGGIAGLWLLNRLLSEGYQAILLEQAALGQGQSIASQGMIHGGMKYALSGALTGASEAIADMPRQWKLCMEGKGEVDLRGTRLLSEDYYLWPRSNLRSRFNAFLGSKTVRGKVDSVAEHDLPRFFRGNISTPLYRLQDIVLDVPSLLATLASRCEEHIYRIDWQHTGIEISNGDIETLRLANGNQLKAKRFVCTSGEGTEFFLQQLQPQGITMQKRPLQMVVVKHQLQDPVYVHCVSAQMTATPELTITTHHCKDGSTAWYLGGELAESGAQRSKQAQEELTRTKLKELFPWCDFSAARIDSLYINRAEARQSDGKRPDQSSLLCAHNMLYCWPTKLTLAPNLANSVLKELAQQGIAPTAGSNTLLAGLEKPALAITPWDAF